MAATAATKRYAHRSMYDGSAAYDLDRREWYEEEQEQQQRAPQPKPEVRRRENYRFSPISAIGAVVAAVLIVFALLGYVNYNELSTETVRLENRIEELREQERKLTVKYEETFDITSIETYAANVLSMSKPDQSQIIELGLSAKDKAVVISEPAAKQAEAGASFGGLVQFFGTLAAYFK